MKRRLTPAAVLVAAVTALSAGLLTLPAHAASSHRSVVATGVPQWATHSADRGAVAASKVIHGRVVLASRDQAGLARYALAVSTPGNPLYHHFLTHAQAQARFGAPSGAHAAVAAWLRSQGLHVSGFNEHWVLFTGTADMVGKTFGTSLHEYAVGAKTVYAPAAPVTVPASLQDDVLTVVGLSQPLVHDHPTHIQSGKWTPATKHDPTVPCSAYEGQKMAKKYPKAYGAVQPFAVCGYGPQQLNGAYGPEAAGYTGKGETIAVVNGYASPTMAKDLNTWDKNRGWQKIKKGQYKEYIPSGTQENDGWTEEEALDIEAEHSMAPDANIVYVAAQVPSDQDFMTAYSTIIDGQLASAVNNSWEGGSDGSTRPATIAAYEALFQEGATQGIGFYFSAGDSGGAGGTGYPSVDPYVTGVGGSAIGIGKTDNYLWETDWETDYTSLSSSGKKWDPKPPGTFQSGTGGGTSTVFKQPKWQKGIVPKKFSEANGSTPMRVSPDIAAEADPTTGFLEGFTVDGAYGETRIGGTSLSSPLIVGMQADAEQAAGSLFGFANPTIYSLYGTKAFNDVTEYPLGKGTMIAHVRTADLGQGTVVALATAGQAADGDLASVKGYDTTTGVGTPTAAYFSSFAQ